MRSISLNRLFALMLAAVLVVAVCGGLYAAPASAAAPWTDAPGAWWTSEYAVTDTQVATVADGFPDGTFRPALLVTRAQFAKMAVTGLGVPIGSPTVPSFVDVAADSIYYPFVEGASAGGLVEGVTTSTGRYFYPNGNISRQQGASILARHLANLELTLAGGIRGAAAGTSYASLAAWFAAEGESYLAGFSDRASIAADHAPGLAYMVFRGLILGAGGHLKPTATLNRAQAAVMILRTAGEAADVSVPPAAPSALAVAPASPGNDSTPVVTGRALAGGTVLVYDTFGGAAAKVAEVTAGANGEFSAVTAALADGTHVFTAAVRTAGGLVSAASNPVTYVLDTGMPTGTIMMPVLPGGQSKATVDIAWPAFVVAAADTGSGVKQVEFQYSAGVGTAAWQSISIDATPETGTSNYAAVWPSSGSLVAGLADGDYLFRAVVTDNAGNTTIAGPRTVTVSTKTSGSPITLQQSLTGLDLWTTAPLEVLGGTVYLRGKVVDQNGSALYRGGQVPHVTYPAPVGQVDYKFIAMATTGGANYVEVWSAFGLGVDAQGWIERTFSGMSPVKVTFTLFLDKNNNNIPDAGDLISNSVVTTFYAAAP